MAKNPCVLKLRIVESCESWYSNVLEPPTQDVHMLWTVSGCTDHIDTKEVKTVDDAT